MRWIYGFILGTALSFCLLGMLALANGTPVPEGGWEQIAGYPTGSAMTTFEITWVIYTGSLIVVFLMSSKKKPKKKA